LAGIGKIIAGTLPEIADKLPEGCYMAANLPIAAKNLPEADFSGKVCRS